MKELRTLHGTARVLQDDTRPPAALIEDVVHLLPVAWQYPVQAARKSGLHL